MGILMAYALWMGAATGSLLGVVADRGGWKAARTGRSRCVCGHPVGPIALLPVLGWLLTAGRARCCGGRVPARYPLAEASLAVAWAGGLYLALAAVPVLGVVALFLGPAVLLLSAAITLRALRSSGRGDADSV